LDEGKRPASRLDDLTNLGRFGDDVDRKHSCKCKLPYDSWSRPS
jgi:hypothetical protein